MSTPSVMDTPNSTQPSRSRDDRAALIRTIAAMLHAAHCREEGVSVVNFDLVSAAEAKPFHDAAEFAVESALSPDRLDVALLAAADAMVATQYRSTYDPMTIFDLSRLTQRTYLAMAVSALHHIRLNLKATPPDFHYRESLAQLLDVIQPKAVL